MELVYLWVEDYKNIHKQGFNFSPRFSCEYDDVKNELTIKENDDYIENFFGENINVTAIVGKNGSGKSSVFEIISDENYKTILIYLESNQLYYYDLHINPIMISLQEINKKEYKKDNLLCLNIYKKYQYKNYNECIYVELSEKESIKNYFKTYKILNKNLVNTKIPNFIYPEYIRLDLNEDYFKKQRDKLLVYASKNHMFRKFHSEYRDFNILHIDEEKQYVIYLLAKLVTTKEYTYVYEDYDYLISALYDFNIDSIKYIENIIKTFSIEFTFSIDEYLKIINSKLLGFKNKPNINIISLKDLEDEHLDKLIFKYIDFFDFDFSDKMGLRNYKNLSHGEKTMFSQFINLFTTIIENEQQEYILFLDEPDNTLHPQWQKEYIDLLIQFLDINFKNKIFHCIITTHSPFLLSDIPKQNIIFLDKDEKGNCKVVDGLKEKKQTFGANIHTLLSDSFFMENGLMGEFAKGKIDEVIKLLNKDKLDKKDLKYCEQIISIIGEPIVKNQLQRMLDSKRLKKVDEIDAIKRNMIAMQKRLDELEK